MAVEPYERCNLLSKVCTKAQPRLAMWQYACKMSQKKLFTPIDVERACFEVRPGGDFCRVNMVQEELGRQIPEDLQGPTSTGTFSALEDVS